MPGHILRMLPIQGSMYPLLDFRESAVTLPGLKTHEDRVSTEKEFLEGQKPTTCTKCPNLVALSVPRLSLPHQDLSTRQAACHPVLLFQCW